MDQYKILPIDIRDNMAYCFFNDGGSTGNLAEKYNMNA